MFSALNDLKRLQLSGIYAWHASRSDAHAIKGVGFRV